MVTEQEYTQKIKDIDLQIKDLLSQKEVLKRNAKDLANKKRKNLILDILDAGLNKEELEYFSKLKELISKLQSLDITVRESLDLKSNLSKLKTDFKNTCTHRFCFWDKGYDGSYSMDYDNASPAVLDCAICGQRETNHHDDYSFGMVKDNNMLVTWLYKTNQKPIIMDNRSFKDTFSQNVHLFRELRASGV